MLFRSGLIATVALFVKLRAHPPASPQSRPPRRERAAEAAAH